MNNCHKLFLSFLTSVAPLAGARCETIKLLCDVDTKQSDSAHGDPRSGKETITVSIETLHQKNGDTSRQITADGLVATFFANTITKRGVFPKKVGKDWTDITSDQQYDMAKHEVVISDSGFRREDTETVSIDRHTGELSYFRAHFGSGTGAPIFISVEVHGYCNKVDLSRPKF